ncbi:MAG: alpha/beta hydrolase [Pseudomonadales bacterium]|nr:alpha/beta hydrolase [Halieaceae bacterium]MCP5163599.1 alpha/beta hydrolase [Pseudomonadales bacterium]MCP5189222.1 alpha/beta hydrolase [Pseudomonadales bacterium]MCP5204517.1 alpha/beta hydrolase [Pseudomonadales bacterium]
MDWLLAALAIFNLVSMITVFSPRAVPRRSVPWAVFGTALLATELAWIWLPLQVILAWLLIDAGALDSGLGVAALLVLLATWPGLVWSIRQSTLAENTVEQALQADLGPEYRGDIPAAASQNLRNEVSWRDWWNPLTMKRPGVEVIRHVPYGPHGVRQQLDIYRPSHIPPEGCPVLLQIHGGAWMIGDKGSQALPLMYHLASRGWICVAANYRLSPSVGFPTHLEDCKRALCWVREHGSEYGMDTSFVAVTGGSAGGHLSALMGLTENRPELQPGKENVDTSVQACIPFYGVYDFLVRYQQHPNKRVYERFLTGKVLHESVHDNPQLWDLASPVAQIHPKAPPFMILHGTLDSLATVAEGRVFSQKLRQVATNPVVYVEMPGAEHAWEIVHSLRTEHTIDGVHRFLEWARGRAAGNQ